MKSFSLRKMSNLTIAKKCPKAQNLASAVIYDIIYFMNGLGTEDELIPLKQSRAIMRYAMKIKYVSINIYVRVSIRKIYMFI